MTKRDLVMQIAEDAQLTQAQASKALDAFVHGVQSGLCRGDRVALAGLGTFTLAARKPRLVRQPRSGAAIRIPARLVARFSPGVELKTAIEISQEKPAPA